MNSFQLAASPSNPRAQSLTRHIVQVLAFTLAFGAPALCSAGGPTKVELSTGHYANCAEDHFTWTRLYIVSATAGLPDQETRPIASSRIRPISVMPSSPSTAMPR